MEMNVHMPAAYTLMTEDEMTYTTGGAWSDWYASLNVAGDVVATLEDADLEAAGLGEAARAGGSRVARSDDDRVIAVGVETGGKALLDAHGNPLCAPSRADVRSPIRPHDSTTSNL